MWPHVAKEALFSSAVKKNIHTHTLFFACYFEMLLKLSFFISLLLLLPATEQVRVLNEQFNGIPFKVCEKNMAAPK